MKKLILAALSAVMSLPLLASSQTTTTTTTTDAPVSVKEVTESKTTREETPVSGDQFTTTTKQSMEEAPATDSNLATPQMEEAAPTNELSSPSVAPSTDPSFQLNEERMEGNEPSFQTAPWEKQKMEDIELDEGEEDEFIPGKEIDDVNEEEEY